MSKISSSSKPKKSSSAKSSKKHAEEKSAPGDKTEKIEQVGSSGEKPPKVKKATPQSAASTPRPKKDTPRVDKIEKSPREKKPKPLKSMSLATSLTTPRSQTPAEVFRSQTPAEVPRSQTPAEVPRSQTPAEVPRSKTPAEISRSQTPAEVPTSPKRPSSSRGAIEPKQEKKEDCPCEDKCAKETLDSKTFTALVEEILPKDKSEEKVKSQDKDNSKEKSSGDRKERSLDRQEALRLEIKNVMEKIVTHAVETCPYVPKGHKKKCKSIPSVRSDKLYLTKSEENFRNTSVIMEQKYPNYYTYLKSYFGDDRGNVPTSRMVEFKRAVLSINDCDENYLRDLDETVGSVLKTCLCPQIFCEM